MTDKERYYYTGKTIGDFLGLFDADNFANRRTTGHNLYDPESLISGAESARGMTTLNSRRQWPNEDTYRAAASGKLSIENILTLAPRVYIGRR